MILRVYDSGNVEPIDVPDGMNEDEYYEKIRHGFIKFVKVDELPKVFVDQDGNYPEQFYRYEDGKVVADVEKIRAIWTQRREEECRSHIFKFYPITKQQSDQADREYFATTLKAKGVANLESDIVARIERFFVGESLEDVVADAQDKEAYLQLIKAGIRVAWVQQCKRELRQAIAEDREPNFPKYPLE